MAVTLIPAAHADLRPPTDSTSAPRRALAEAVGTAYLLTAIVGSGIMGERLADGNVALALLANTLATGAALTALVLTFGPVSGAHFNPIVTLVDAWQRRSWRPVVPWYLAAQFVGGCLGVMVAHAMFGEPIIFTSATARAGGAQMLSEVVATFGLTMVILLGSRFARPDLPFIVAAYITAAYWFTASTSFANPAVTLARSLTDTFAGIRPSDVPGFVLAQLLGGGAALVVCRWMVPGRPPVASEQMR